MIQKQCGECNKIFNYEPPVGFPDKRKYCDDCSAARKAQWDAKQGKPIAHVQTMPKAPGVVSNNTTEARHDVVIQRTEKPHSYEFGPAKARHKIYYADPQDLMAHIEALKDLGLLSDDPDIKLD
jgi:hypothetical protein